MKHLLLLSFLFLLLSCSLGTKGGRGGSHGDDDSDSTLYGECGSGTTMHSLQLITGLQDTINIFINAEDSDALTTIAGGLMCGDRMAVIATLTDGTYIAQRVINITSLLGRWVSIDKDFEIMEGGDVMTNNESQSDLWTAWRILNGQLLLDTDTFDILTLSADTMDLESTTGIFSFCRIHSDAYVAEGDTITVDSIAEP